MRSLAFSMSGDIPEILLLRRGNASGGLKGWKGLERLNGRR